MSDRQMLSEDETLRILRVGWTGAAPPMRDVAPLAMYHGQRLRTRRRAARITGAVALSLVGTLTVGTGVVALAGRDDTVTVAGPERSQLDGLAGAAPTVLAAANVNILSAALGPDFDLGESGGGALILGLRPDSPSARKLPAGYTAEADVTVGTTKDIEVCNPSLIEQFDGTKCELVAGGPVGPPPDGAVPYSDVVLRSASSPLEPGAPVELRQIFAFQPDGDVIRAQLVVRPSTVVTPTTEVPRTAISDWLSGFVPGLQEAATDPEMAPGSVREREKAAQPPIKPRNALRVLADALGADFAIEQGPHGKYVGLLPDSPAGKQLPPGFVADATVSVTWSSYADATCGDGGFSHGPGGACAGHALEDSTLATTLREQPALANPTRTQVLPGEAVAVRSAHYTRDDGSTAAATLVVRPSNATPIAQASVPADMIAAWLVPFESKLLTVATDPRIASPSGQEGDTNDIRLQRALGSAWTIKDGIAQSTAPAAGGERLPDGAIGGATISVFAGAALQRQLCTLPPDTPTSTCTRRSVDGNELSVEVQPPFRHDGGGGRYGSIAVKFPRANGEIVSIVVTAVDAGKPGEIINGEQRMIPPGGDLAARDAQIVAWLKTWEEALVRAVTDPAMTQFPGYADPRR